MCLLIIGMCTLKREVVTMPLLIHKILSLYSVKNSWLCPSALPNSTQLQSQELTSTSSLKTSDLLTCTTLSLPCSYPHLLHLSGHYPRMVYYSSTTESTS